MSTVSEERVRNKRDTMSRLSEILDNLHMPEYPDATATSPSRHANLQNDVNDEYRGFYDEDVDTSYVRRFQSPVRGDFSDLNAGYIDSMSEVSKNNNNTHDPLQPHSGAGLLSSPELDPVLTEKAPVGKPGSNPNSNRNSGNHDSSNHGSSHNDSSNSASFPSRISGSIHSVSGYQQISNPQVQMVPTAGTAGGPQIGKVSTGVIRESAQQIINTYLSPRAPRRLNYLLILMAGPWLQTFAILARCLTV